MTMGAGPRKPPDSWGANRERVRSEAIRELFEIPPEELAIKTNTPPRLVKVFSLMKVMEAADDPERTVPLSKIYRDAHDRRMISRSGKGREELVRITHGPMSDSGEELDLL